MSTDQDITQKLMYAAAAGRLEEVRELIKCYGLSYSRKWSNGYILLRRALKNGHSEVAKLLLISGCKVNPSNPRADTLLHYAVKKKDLKVVEMLLDRNANVHARNRFGKTALHIAYYGSINWKLIELLLNRGCHIDDRDNKGKTILHAAVYEGCLQTVEKLVNYGANVNSQCAKRNSPLHLAVNFNQEEIVQFLLSRQAIIDIRERGNLTPLHIAAQRGYTNIAKNLLNHDADIHSVTSREKYTPLHFAAEKGDNELVKLLLEHGAKVDVEDKNGKTVLIIAVEKGSLIIVKDILKYSPDINNESNRNSLKTAVSCYRSFECSEYKEIAETLLEYGFMFNRNDIKNPELQLDAAKNGFLKIVESLLINGADVHSRLPKPAYDEEEDDSSLCDIDDEEGSTPLHIAVKYEQAEVVQFLINYGADINAKTKKGKTPIFYATQNGDFELTNMLINNGANFKDNAKLLRNAISSENTETVETLLKHNIDINAVDEYGETALHFTAATAFSIISIETVNLLLSHGADIEARTKDCETTLHIAARGLCDEMCPILLKEGANVHARRNDGCTALHIAASRGCCLDVATLLDYGADINSICNNGKSALDYAANSFRPVHNLKSYIIKMIIAKLYVCEENLRHMKNVSVDEGFEDLMMEIDFMKKEKFKNTSISFYDILAKNENSLANYMRNKVIVDNLQSGEYKKLFPNYAYMITCNFRNGLERKKLLERGNKIFYLYFNKFFALPNECVENILSNLSNNDLRSFEDAKSLKKTL